jgi:hypothetical protein
VTARARVQVWGLTALWWLLHVGDAAAEREVTPRASRDGYAVSIAAYEHYATRRDFANPVFLFQQPVEEVRVHEFGLRLNLELDLVWGLGLAVELPFVYRRAAVRYAPAWISLDQRTPATYRELSAAGMADPALAVRYRLLRRETLGATVAAGVRIPVDDNPGSGVAPEQLPLSTGQREWFLQAGLAATLEPFRFALDYHLGYHPGDASSYLVRRISGNQVASGVLGDFVGHRAELGVMVLPNAPFSIELAPSFRVDENPPLIEQGKEYALTRERLRYELGLEGRLYARFGRAHRLELFYEQPLLAAHDEDPFFPIAVPAQGFGLAWRVTGP